MLRHLKIVNILFLINLYSCFNKPSSGTSNEKGNITFRGLNFVAPPEEFAKNPFAEVKSVAADWVAVIPYGYTMPKQNKVIYNVERWQWWGETPQGVQKTIQLAHEAGIYVMLKPQVYFPRSWSGYLDFDNEADWASWEKDYTNYIMTFVKMAIDEKVEMICVGTEFKISVTKREKYWRNLISEIRKIYNGKLTYASNWDEFPVVPFWDDLDFIGVNAYFPLINEQTPTVEQLTKVWKKPIEDISIVQKKFNKPVIFTEYGYLSVDGCAYNSWELEDKINSLSINQDAQANAIEGLWKACAQKHWWQGGFIWKWFPNMRGHEGYPEKDYTPQGKKGEMVLKNMHQN